VSDLSAAEQVHLFAQSLDAQYLQDLIVRPKAAQEQKKLRVARTMAKRGAGAARAVANISAPFAHPAQSALSASRPKET